MKRYLIGFFGQDHFIAPSFLNNSKMQYFA